MTEESPAAPPANAPIAAPPRPKAGGVALLASVLALGAAGYALWSAGESQRALAELAKKAQATEGARSADATRIDTELAALKRDAQALARKVGDSEAGNTSVREELLGLGERAGMIEDALRSMAERRLQGQLALKVNEAEFLLRAGVERLKLFHDVAGAVDAYRLADQELSEIEDPVFAGVRQTIAAELKSIEQAGTLDRSTAMNRLDELATLAHELPTRAQVRDAPQVPRTEGWLDKAEAALAQFVRVRRLDAAEVALLNPLYVDTAREALALEIGLAKAALAQGDDARFRASLEAAAQRAQNTFSVSDPTARRFRDGLAALRATPAPAALPELGRALTELRNLRATRTLADGARAAKDAAKAEPKTP